MSATKPPATPSRPAAWAAVFFIALLPLQAFALDGIFTVTESWSATLIYTDWGNQHYNGTKHFSGTQTGTLSVSNGVFTLIDKTGLPHTPPPGLQERTIRFDGSQYPIRGGTVMPYVLAGVNLYGVLYLSEFMVRVPLVEGEIPDVNKYTSYHTTGDSLSVLAGSGDQTGMDLTVTVTSTSSWKAAPAAPSITVPPASQSVSAGSSASFSVQATGSPAPTYQWQRLPAGLTTWSSLSNGGAYFGTTTAVLSVTGITEAMNGDQFRCVVKNSVASRTSTAAKLTVTAAPVQPPSFSWATHLGATSNALGSSIVADPAGGFYVGGVFSGTASFGGVHLTSRGGWDTFVARYDGFDKLVWASGGGGAFDDSIFGIGLDNAANCYVGGVFDGAAAFGGFSITNTSDPFGQNGFIAKYDGAGNVLWARQISGSMNNGVVSIAVDAAGHSYVTGDFAGTANFGSTPLKTSEGDNDIFVAKYGATGNLLWVKQAGGQYNNTGARIALDSQGNCYVAGIFSDTALFGAHRLTTTNGSDTFLAKYTASGSVAWVKQIQRTTSALGALDVAVDGNGDAYLTGAFSGVAMFGGSSLVSAGGFDFFLAKYSPAGALLWVKRGGDPSNDETTGVAVDSTSDAYLFGMFSASMSVAGDNLTSLGLTDLFVAKYDKAGDPLWAVQVGGPSIESALDIAVDSAGDCYLTGLYSNRVAFGSIALTGTGGLDAYVAKLGGAAPPPLKFIPGSLAFDTSGSLRLELNGAPGSAVVIQASSDLTRWTQISTNSVSATGTLILQDPGARSQRHRFYRAVSP